MGPPPSPASTCSDASSIASSASMPYSKFYVQYTLVKVRSQAESCVQFVSDLRQLRPFLISFNINCVPTSLIFFNVQLYLNRKTVFTVLSMLVVFASYNLLQYVKCIAVIEGNNCPSRISACLCWDCYCRLVMAWSQLSLRICRI